MKGIIFFAHGARDERWRQPFDRLNSIWAKRYPEIPAQLAFLEKMQPDLPGAIQILLSKGVSDVEILPIFFGQGAHLHDDFPIIIKECRTMYPNIKIRTSPPVGENDEVLGSIINVAFQSLSASK
jgi:sirohydrochlorin cobaltochelatase